MEERSTQRRIERSGGVAKVAVVGSGVYFFVRLLSFVSQNSVNVLFHDHWHFFRPFFEGQSLWAAFRHQHGPHRQGVGSLVIALSNLLTDWDMRVLGLVTTWLLVLALLVAVRLKVALYGKLTLMDIVLPPLFFRLSQYESLALIPNPAHGVIPLILILVTCLALVSGRRAQLVTLPLLTFFTVHTGFGFLLPPLLIVVLAVRCASEWKVGMRRESWNTAGAIFLSMLATAPFFIDYRWTGNSLPCTEENTPGPGAWVAWPFVMASRYFGLQDFKGWPFVIGAVLFMLPAIGFVATVLARGSLTWSRKATMKSWSAIAVPVVLLGYSISFSLVSAAGRICGGSARSSRYVTHMIPLGVGLYFVYLLLRAGTEEPGGSPFRFSVGRGVWSRRAVSAIGVVLVAFSFIGASSLTHADRFLIEQFYTGKVRWVDCMLEGGDAVTCNRISQFRIFSDPTLLQSRVEFLRRNRKSFYSGRKVVERE